MKKLLSLLLCGVMIFSLMSLVGCAKDEPLKLGLGVVSYVEKVTNADADTDGAGSTVTTAAAVLIDKDGKIVDCVIDTAAYTQGFTSKGKYVKANEIKTKYEQGTDYGMVAYGGAKKEWFEQVDAFTALCEGKTLQDVKALVATNGKGNDDVVNAGCTIFVTDFVKALEAAFNNAKESGAIAGDKLNLAFVSTQTGSKDATEEAEGLNEIDATITAAAVNGEGKISAIVTDALQAKISFSLKGEAAVTANQAFTTKLQAGDAYGMAQYGQDLNGDGTVKEWYAQAAEFDKACVGKTADEVAKLAIETGYGVEEVQTAGCTMNIADMVKAAQKAAK